MAATWSAAMTFPDESWVTAPADGEDLAAWAQEICAFVDPDPAVTADLGEDLRDHALLFRSREYDAGALWLPDPLGHGVLASAFLDRVVADPGGVLTRELVADLERAADSPGLTPSDVELVELPAGPAVRTRRLEAVTAPDSDRILLGESVSHVVVRDDLHEPDGRPVAVRFVVGWRLLSAGDDLATLADDCAALLRIEA